VHKCPFSKLTLLYRLSLAESLINNRSQYFPREVFMSSKIPFKPGTKAYLISQRLIAGESYDKIQEDMRVQRKTIWNVASALRRRGVNIPRLVKPAMLGQRGNSASAFASQSQAETNVKEEAKTQGSQEPSKQEGTSQGSEQGAKAPKTSELPLDELAEKVASILGERLNGVLDEKLGKKLGSNPTPTPAPSVPSASHTSKPKGNPSVHEAKTEPKAEQPIGNPKVEPRTEQTLPPDVAPEDPNIIGEAVEVTGEKVNYKVALNPEIFHFYNIFKAMSEKRGTKWTGNFGDFLYMAVKDVLTVHGIHPTVMLTKGRQFLIELPPGVGED